MVGASQLMLSRGQMKFSEFLIRKGEDSFSNFPAVAKPFVRTPVDIRWIFCDSLTNQTQFFKGNALFNKLEHVRR